MKLMLWRKSYMLEFLKNEQLDKTWTFSVPPQSEEFTFPHRVSISKTLGGNIFDNYGNDLINITLSGSTINNEKKIIYEGNMKPPRYLTGEQEVFELEKLLSAWHAVGFDDDYKEIYLYDLSKMSLMQIATGGATRNYWRVVIKDFKIKRDKGNPNTYNYTIQMLGLVSDKWGSHQGSIFTDDPFSQITKIAKTVQSIEKKAEGISKLISSGISSVQKVQNLFKKLSHASPRLLTSTLLNSVDGCAKIFTGEGGDSLVNISKNAIQSVKGARGVFDAKTNMKSFNAHKTKKSKHEDARIYTVSFITGEGSALVQKVALGCFARKIEPSPRGESYTFDGWYTESNFKGSPYDFFKPVTKSFSLWAKWLRTRVTITFIFGNGQKAYQEVDIGSHLVSPNIIEWEGHKFIGWARDSTLQEIFDIDNDTVTSEMTNLYALWEEAYRIDFVTGEGATQVESQYIQKGGKVMYPCVPQKENCTFMLWAKDKEGEEEFNFSLPIYKSIVLYAIYLKELCNVTFNTYGGSEVASQVVKMNDKIKEPPAPNKAGYTFDGWYKDKEYKVSFDFFTTKIIKDTIIYAKWNIRFYTITFIDTTDYGEQTVEYGGHVQFITTPKKEGKQFIGFVKVEDTGEESEFDFSMKVVSDLKLKALWV